MAGLSLDDLDGLIGGAPPPGKPRVAAPRTPKGIGLDALDEALNAEAPAPPEPAAGGVTLGDLGQTLKAGAGDVVQGVGWLAKQVGLPDGVESYGREMSQNAEAAMSPAARDAMGKEFVTEGPDGYGIGPALTDPAAIGLTALRSAPSMAAMLIPGAGTARGVQMAGRGLAAIAPRAGAMLSRPFVSGAIGYGAAEGALTGGQDAAQSEQAVLAMPLETLRASPEFQGLVAETGSEDAARQKLAADIASGVAWKTGLVTGILGGVAGGGLEHLIQGGARGVLRSAGKQALTEAATEAPQSAAEQAIQNIEEARADPTREAGKGVLNQAVAGGLVGGLTGGALGGGAAAISPRTKAGRAQAETLADTALPGAEVIGAEPPAPMSLDALDEAINSPPPRPAPAGQTPPVTFNLGREATPEETAAADRVAPAMQAEADRLAADQAAIDAGNARAAAARAARERPARQAADIAAIKAAGEDLTAASRDYAARVAEPAYNPADELPDVPPPAPPAPQAPVPLPLDQIDTTAADRAAAQIQGQADTMLAGRDAMDAALTAQAAARREAERPAREKAAAAALRQDAKVTQQANQDYARAVRQGPQFDPAEYQSPIRFERDEATPLSKRQPREVLTPNWDTKEQGGLFGDPTAYIRRHVSVGNERQGVRLGTGIGRDLGEQGGYRFIRDGNQIIAARPADVTVQRDGAIDVKSIVGTLKVKRQDDERVINHIVVSPEFQRQGIATNLLRLGEQEFPDLRTDKTTGLVSPDGAAVLNAYNAAKPQEVPATTREELGQGAVIAEYDTAPELVAAREAVARNIGTIIARMAGDRTAAVRVADRLTSLGRPVTGAMIPADRLIAVAMNAPDPVGTVHHETIHLLKEIGAISDGDWAILSRAAEERGWLKRHRIDDRYPSLDKAGRIEEAIASAFADFQRGRKTGNGVIDRIFEALAEFLRRVASAVRAALGRDATPEELFRRIDRGDMRPKETPPPGRTSAPSVDEAKGEAAPKLERDVETAEGRQAVAQGFIGRGQPVDRAIRIPFDFFGGLTPDGQWKPGIALTKAAERVIKDARFSDRSSFRFMNDWIHQARAGLIDRYGLPDDFVKRDRQRENDERKILMRGIEFLKALAEREMTLAEARALHGVLVGDGIASGDWEKLAAPIRQNIDQMAAEAVELGLISPEAYERNRGTYLHRSYEKHEADMTGLARLASAFMGSRRKKFIGDQLKGRGMFLEVMADRLPDGADGIGDRVRVADLLGDDGKVKRRQYLAEGAAVPEGYTDKGVWTVRQGRGDRAVIWRDFTKPERERMGEILDARYAIGKTYMLMAHDLATGRFYRDIAGNAEWTRTEEPEEGTWKDAAEVSRFKRDPNVAWVKVPETAMSQTGGKKRWGALSGKYVRAEIWADINELAEMQRSGFWRTLLQEWKKNKTSRSPATHMNNVVSNVVFADLADVRWQDIVTGIRMLAGKNQDWRDAVEHGAFGGDQISQEIRQNVLEPLLQELAKQGAGTGAKGRFGTMNTIAERLWSAAKRTDQAMLDAYQMEDTIFRAAAYMRRRALGDNAETAANFARDQFLDYDIRAPWVNAARNSLLPFISYTYRAVPVIARSIATRPWKMAKYATLAYGANALFRGLAGDSPEDEEKQRRSMREDERAAMTILGVPVSPRLIRMPLDDATGAPVYLDIRRFLPAGDVFDTSQGQSPIPAPLQFGGPLLMAFEAALNKTSFDGKEIFNKYTDKPTEIAAKYADWLWKSWMPSAAWVPGSWYWTKIAEAMDGVRDRSGKAYSLPLAAASSVGIKLRPQDVDQNFAMRAHEYDKVGRELRFQMTTIARDQERGALSPAQAEKAVAALVEKQQRLAEKRMETFR